MIAMELVDSRKLMLAFFDFVSFCGKKSSIRLDDVSIERTIALRGFKNSTKENNIPVNCFTIDDIEGDTGSSSAAEMRTMGVQTCWGVNSYAIF